MRRARAGRKSSGERALRGVGAAPGIVAGRAVVLDRDVTAGKTIVPESERAAQLAVARDALAQVANDLSAMALRLRDEGSEPAADMVETGVMMAGDPVLQGRLESLVAAGRSAQAAIREATEEIAMELAKLSDPTLAERADDVRSLGRRAAARAAGLKTIAGGDILVASSLGPADVAELAATAKGVALGGGGITAHAAIVARSLGLPMVVGLGPEVSDVADGEEVVVDGDEGLLVRFPEPARMLAATAYGDRRRRARLRALTNRLEPAETKDGHRVRVLANAAGRAEVLEALEQGAEGIGLLRTELLFLEARSWPSRQQQVGFLGPVLSSLAGKTATVRLFDFGGDKTPPFLAGTRLRGVELLLRAPAALRDQLDAILDAGRDTQLRILIPMVTTVEEVRAVRAALAAVLGTRRPPLLGAMIETPDAAVHALELAHELDFMSLGTNDLTQMVLGMDRERAKTAPVLHPKVIRLIDSTMRAGRSAGIPVDVCGEAASDPVAMPVMVGLGADELSVAAARVGEVRAWIRDLAFDASRRAAEARLLGQAVDAAG